MRGSTAFDTALRDRPGTFMRARPVRLRGIQLRRWPILLIASAALLLTSCMVGGASYFPHAGLVQRARATSGTPTGAPAFASGVSDNSALNAAEGCASGPPAPATRAIGSAQRTETADPTPREVALTFDDGPSPSSSPAILDLLERSHTPATFFVIGQQVARWPTLVQREWLDGFAIGVHTWDHPMMTTLSNARMSHELSDTTAAIHQALGNDVCIWLWRPPYEDYNQRVIQAADAQGLTTITWNVDPRDWSRPGTDAIIQRALSAAGPGAIILFHDGPALREQTAAALPIVISTLRARGLKLVTVPQLLADAHFPGIHMTPPSPSPRLCAAGRLLSQSFATALLGPNMPVCLPREAQIE